jgi:hypothetical protein
MSFKYFNKSDITLREIQAYKTFNLDSTSDGISSIRYASGSKEHSYYLSLRVNFFLSGSTHYPTGSFDHTRLANPFLSYSTGRLGTKPQHLHKFKPSGSIISISPELYGQRIRKGSFILNDTHYSKTVTIKDDGYGNLYSSNAVVSQSTTAASSSDNYVGNIFYDKGIAVITENSPWSGSVKYAHITSGSNYTVQFDSVHSIFEKEFTMKIAAHEFNSTSNPTARQSTTTHPTASNSPHLLPKLINSHWNPYFTSIGLYEKDGIFPVLIAKYPKAIKIPTDIELVIKLKIDM